MEAKIGPAQRFGFICGSMTVWHSAEVVGPGILEGFMQTVQGLKYDVAVARNSQGWRGGLERINGLACI